MADLLKRLAQLAGTSADPLAELARLARFEEGKSVDVPEYLREHGNEEAADAWVEMNEEHRDNFKTAGLTPEIEKIISHLERQGYDSKDSARVQDIVKKSIGDPDKEARLSLQMAMTIKGYEKAYRRFLAAEDNNFHGMAAIFYKRFMELVQTGKKASEDDDEDDQEERLAALERLASRTAAVDMAKVKKFPGVTKATLKGKTLTVEVERYLANTAAKSLVDKVNDVLAKDDSEWSTANDDSYWPAGAPEGKTNKFVWTQESAKKASLQSVIDIGKDAGKDEGASEVPNGDEKKSRYEEGKPADPTENMSPEDAKEWNENTEEYGDKFKKAAAGPVTKAQVEKILEGEDYTFTKGYSGKGMNGAKSPLAVTTDVAPNSAAGKKLQDDLGMSMDGMGKKFVYYTWPTPKKKASEEDDEDSKKLEASYFEALETTDKTAAGPAGLYGFTRGIQADCESSVRKLQKAAAKIAKDAYKKDENIAPFLSTHAKRADSLPAKILIEAMKSIGPKIASEEEEKPEEPKETEEKEISKEAARKFGLYGYLAKTASLGLSACTQMRDVAGHVASELHGRKADKHAHVTGFLDSHSKQGKCMYSKLLHSSYPESDRKVASVEPQTVAGWLNWEE